MKVSNEDKGILAALSAPFFMALGFITWENVWTKRGSAFSLNLFKCNMASILFLILGLIFGFTVENDYDENSTFESIGFLVVSGLIGIVVGDLFWLEALRRLGAFKVLLIDTLKPFAATFCGRMILGESINEIAYVGIVFTAFGVLIVSVEQQQSEIESSSSGESTTDASTNLEVEKGDNVGEVNALPLSASVSETKCEENCIQIQDEHKEENHEDANSSLGSIRMGYFLAFSNILLDTGGSILTKVYGAKFTTWGINLIRFGSSGTFLIFVSVIMRLLVKRHSIAEEYEVFNKASWYRLPSNMSYQDWSKVSLGVVFVTFLCPALSNYALFQIALALALTLGSITPVYALILEWAILRNKRPTLRAIIGASLAVAGVAGLSIFKNAG